MAFGCKHDYQDEKPVAETTKKTLTATSKYPMLAIFRMSVRMWTKNSDPFRISWWGLGLVCSALISSLSWWKVCGKQTSREKSCSLSLWIWLSAFDSVSAQVLGDVLPEKGATTISAAAAVRENLELRARLCFGVHKKCFVRFGCGHETGRPKNTFRLEPGYGGVD